MHLMPSPLAGRDRNSSLCLGVFSTRLTRCLHHPPRRRQLTGAQKGNHPMTSMNPILRDKLLQHWQNYHPNLLTELQREGQLEEALETKVEQVTNLMYELEIVQGMQRAAAWEIVLDQYFLPEETDESGSTNQNQSDSPPETSE